MKFSNAGGHLSLQAVAAHLKKYPDFLKDGGVYEIPSDHYERIKWLLSIPENEANKMPTGTGEFSLSQWKEVHEFFSDGNIPQDAIKPSRLAFPEVQRNTYEQTLGNEKDSLKERNQERREQAYQESKPSLQEGAKATLGAAAVEGGAVAVVGAEAVAVGTKASLVGVMLMGNSKANSSAGYEHGKETGSDKATTTASKKLWDNGNKNNRKSR